MTFMKALGRVKRQIYSEFSEIRAADSNERLSGARESFQAPILRCSNILLELFGTHQAFFRLQVRDIRLMY